MINFQSGNLESFSPVAGIQWVETTTGILAGKLDTVIGFSPVAGIQWVETSALMSPFRVKTASVSVPLPGFSGLRHSRK